MTWRDNLADWISDGALTRARREAEVARNARKIVMTLYRQEFKLRQDIQTQLGDALAEKAHRRAKIRRLHEALTASADTKCAYMGEVECECTGCLGHHVPWTSIKQIMRMIRTRAALEE